MKRNLIILKKIVFLRLSINLFLREIMLQLQRSTLNENLLLQNFKQNIEKNKSHGDKRGQYYSNKIETPTRETIFVESKEETPKPITSFRTPS